MDPFALFYIWAAMNAAGLVMALYIDHRTRRRVRSGALPAGVFLLGWGQSGVNHFILFSPTFLRSQDGARSLVWLLRLIVCANIIGLVWLAYLAWTLSA